MKSSPPIAQKDYQFVSVPLRGRGNEIEGTPNNSRSIEPEKFPSPCGEEVMKSKKRRLTLLKLTVSVPLRGRGNEMLYYKGGAWVAEWFPSPCGEEVMK